MPCGKYVIVDYGFNSTTQKYFHGVYMMESNGSQIGSVKEAATLDDVKSILSSLLAEHNTAVA